MTGVVGLATVKKEVTVVEKAKIPEPGSPEDYMDLTVGDFSETLACFTPGDDRTTHIGRLFIRITACGKPLGDTVMSRTCRITCPECITEVRFRQSNPEACKKEFGDVTHKGGMV